MHTAHTRRCLLLLAATLALLAALPALPAAAQELKPLGVILLDTSNSMEYNLGPANTFPTCYTRSGGGSSWCDDGAANASHTRSRFTVARDVLTGRFIDQQYYCCAVERSTQEPDPTMQYHFTVPERIIDNRGRATGVGQVQDGIMDIYKDDLRFALMTLDNDPGPNNGNAGGWSYGPDVNGWNTGAKNARSNRGNHGGYKNVDRGSGALKAIPRSEDPAVMQAQNLDLQDEIRWLFPYGALNPMASFIDDARYYILEDENIQNDQCLDIRPKGVILVTDGQAQFEECYVPGLADGADSPTRIDYDGNGTNNDCNAFKFGNQTYKYPWWYYKTSPLMAEKLLAETDFPTYVIGFGAGPEADALLRKVAYAGQTCADMGDADCYYMASDRTQLQFAFHDVVSRLNAQGPDFRSRARPITSTRTSFRDEKSGYYEVSADFTTTTRRPRGRIERVTYTCDSSGQFVQSRVEDFADALARMAPLGRTLFTARSTTTPGSQMPQIDDVCASIAGCTAATLRFLRGGSSGNTPFLADMYHGSPVLAVGPELDLPLSGYKAFRNTYGNRDSVLYVPTNGGVLHALLMADIDNDAPIEEGQELWAYVPRTIHPKLPTLPSQRQLTVDGTPIIRDVRLYNDPQRQPAEQWATVLIGTLRGGGRGVFALDISDPYQPKFLWEINSEDPGFQRLGDTYAEASIGSVALSNGETTYEAAVVILPGGVSSGTTANEGQSLYVIELATGRLLRTFTTLTDGTALPQMTGAATPSSSFPGTLMTRAFLGDAKGRLLRLGFPTSDPEDWTLDVFFDPTPYLAAGKLPERIMQPPAVAKDKDNNLVVVYGSGDHASLSPAVTNANFVASLTEEVFVSGDQISVRARENWVFTDPTTPFKLSSPVLVFDSTAYFATLARSNDACINYGARLYGFHFTEADANGEPKSRVDLNGAAVQSYAEFAPGTSIFGMDLTVRPTCVPSLDPDGTGGGALTASAALQQSSPPKPQLVVQTGVQAYASGSAPAGTTDAPMTANERVAKARIDIPRPSQNAFPLSWSAVYE